MASNSKKKQSVSTRREEFVKDYIQGSQVFFREAATRKDALRAWTDAKKARKKKPVIRKPEMTKEEFYPLYLEHCERWNELPTELDFNREWDLIELERKYKAIRGKNKKDLEQKQRAFLDHMEQEMKRRHPSTK